VNKSWTETLQKAAKILIPTEESKILIRPVGEVLAQAEQELLSAEQKKKFSKMASLTRKKEWSETRRCERELKDYSVRSFSGEGSGD
jgi:hypothetical protein